MKYFNTFSPVIVTLLPHSVIYSIDACTFSPPAFPFPWTSTTTKDGRVRPFYSKNDLSYLENAKESQMEHVFLKDVVVTRAGSFALDIVSMEVAVRRFLIKT